MGQQYKCPVQLSLKWTRVQGILVQGANVMLKVFLAGSAKVYDTGPAAVKGHPFVVRRHGFSHLFVQDSPWMGY